MAIKLLSQDVINKIAAGEVIERPASVIKEAIENSIDAKAQRIDISLENSGKTKMIISDDGLGMSEDDLKMCVLKHATSKIFSSDDLFKIHTLGFRGEALASIETISRLTIQSRTADSDFGYELSNFEKPNSSVYGEQFSIKKTAMDPGTRIIVQDIFHNTPARLNYLKNDYVELNHIIDLVKKYALCFPEKSFRVTNNGKVVFITSGQNDELTNIKTIFNDSFTEHLLRVEHKDYLRMGTGISSYAELKGFVSEPGYLTNSSENIIFFLNDRYIKSKFLSDSIIDAYKTLSFLSEKPAAIIHLYMNADEYDINVHPRKLDVRFKHESRLYEIILLAVKSAIEKFNESRKNQIFEDKSVQSVLQEVEVATTFSKDISKIYSVRNRTSDSDYQKGIAVYDRDISDSSDGNLISDESSPDSIAETLSEVVEDESDLEVIEEDIEDADYTKYLAELEAENNNGANSSDETPNDFDCDEEDSDMGEKVISGNYRHNVLGIIDNTYILVKSAESIFIVDQHALHERILFERLKNEFDDNLSKKNTQTLLSPLRVELSSKSLENLFDRKELFERLGFEFEMFGNSSILLRRIPYAFFDIPDKSSLINAILSDFDFGKMEDSVLERLATISCKAAIKAHDELTETQVDNLLDMFFKRGMMHTCPHGRPFFIEIGKKEIEKMFKRA